MLVAYKKVTESASFFTYINVTQSAFFLHIKCPPLRQFQKFNEKSPNAKCQAFCI